MDTKKVIASVAVGALLMGAGVLGGATLFPKEIEKEVIVEVPVEVIKTITIEKNVTVEVPVEVEKVVEVENTNMPAVLQYIEDNYDDEVTEEYILFETDARIEAEAFIRENIVSLLDDEDYFDDGEVLGDYRKSEVSIKKIEDAVANDKNYDDLEVELVYEVKVRAKEGGDDAEYFSFEVTVPFENGKLVEEDASIQLI